MCIKTPSSGVWLFALELQRLKSNSRSQALEDEPRNCVSRGARSIESWGHGDAHLLVAAMTNGKGKKETRETDR